MRSLLAAVAAVGAAALGAVIIGEYELRGATPLVAGVLFGLLLAELVTAVAGRRTLALAAMAGAAAASGLVWAAWISSGRDWSFVPAEAWAGVVVAPFAAVTWIRGGRRRAAGTPGAP